MTDPYIGEIRLFAGNYAPQGWALCNGATLSIQGNEPLYSLIGTMYGGDGRTQFNLPDLRGRLPIGIGLGTGLSTNYIPGQTGGVNTVTLTEAQIPSHTHSLMANTTAATTDNPVDNLLADPADPLDMYIPYNSATTTVGNLADGALERAGGNGPHENRMPTTALNYIIATQGIYPQFQ